MLFRACLLVAFVLLAVSLQADDAKDRQKSLEKTLVNHVFIIRNFYGGDHLTFDSQGNLLRGSESDCWCAAMLKVQKIEIRKGVLTLRGPRIVGWYDLTKATLSDLHQQSEEVQLDIELGSTDLNDELVKSVLQKVFLTKNDDLKHLIPGVRRAATKPEPTLKRRGDTPTHTDDEPNIGDGEEVRPPEVIYAPDPEYTEVARKKKREGSVVLWVVIDAEGRPRDTKIEKCLGAGLDESAIEAVSRWRFKPAKKNGQPVAVQMNIDVTFHLN